ncbi:MAG: diheme cytochrome c [Helicobacteraceae bacterium]|jgi:cytochrome c553|nr:diheme cytochrome c [Helicobacteraceae bacterium]
MKSLLLIPVIATMLVGGVYLMADDDHYEKGNIKQRAAQLPVSPQQQSYIKECSSCHMAYQAEFLPKRTWAKMMNGLDDHFGVDASLTAKDEKILFDYLQKNAADSKRVGKHFAKMAASAGDTSLRISDTRYFKKEHRKIPQKYIDQKEVKSIANCNACHQKAESGDYRERGISIPNYGRWDD